MGNRGERTYRLGQKRTGDAHRPESTRGPIYTTIFKKPALERPSLSSVDKDRARVQMAIDNQGIRIAAAIRSTLEDED